VHKVMPSRSGLEDWEITLAIAAAMDFPMKYNRPSEIMTGMRAKTFGRVAPGVVYTTFHHPRTQANAVTTEFSDGATYRREYKVTAE
jgi:predicted molibdopterin-dependent oxidoreductase YjgC